MRFDGLEEPFAGRPSALICWSFSWQCPGESTNRRDPTHSSLAAFNATLHPAKSCHRVWPMWEMSIFVDQELAIDKKKGQRRSRKPEAEGTTEGPGQSLWIDQTTPWTPTQSLCCNATSCISTTKQTSWRNRSKLRMGELLQHIKNRLTRSTRWIMSFSISAWMLLFVFAGVAHNNVLRLPFQTISCSLPDSRCASSRPPFVQMRKYWQESAAVKERGVPAEKTFN